MFSNLSDAKQYEKEKALRYEPHGLPNWRLLECWTTVNDVVIRLTLRCEFYAQFGFRQRNICSTDMLSERDHDELPF